MIAYNTKILELIPGNTPLKKHENLKGLLSFLYRVGYPRKGTSDEEIGIQDVADWAIELLPFTEEYESLLDLPPSTKRL